MIQLGQTYDTWGEMNTGSKAKHKSAIEIYGCLMVPENVYPPNKFF